MPEEIKKQQDEQSVEDKERYLSALEEMKKTHVPKSHLKDLKDENERLLKAIIDGDQIDTSDKQKQSIDRPARIKELRQELFGQEKELSNLEYVSKSLELRDHILEESGEDIFVGGDTNKNAKPEDYSKAQQIADSLKECVEFAQGDSAVFTNELQRRMVDIGLRK